MRLRLILLAFLTFGCASASEAQTAVRYINDWKWEGQHSPFLMAEDKGYFDEESLDVTLVVGKGSTYALPEVAAGNYDIGSADINSLITWRDQNPDVDMKAVYIIYNSPPYAVLGRPSLGVTGPLDLEGHVLGAPKFDGAYAQWPAFVVANGILEDRVTIEDVAFPVRESKLASGDVQAITGFSFTSYISLQKEGVPKEDISLMLMSDFGLDLYGNAIIVNPAFAKENPAAVRGFISATIRAYQDTIANPTAAVEHVLARVDDADMDTELKRLVMAIGHHIVTDEVRRGGLGDVVDARLEKSIAQLDSIHGFSSIPAADDIFDDRFLPSIEERLLLDLASTDAAAATPSDTPAEESDGQ